MKVQLNVSVNSGAALFLWLAAFFGVLLVSKSAPAVAEGLILTLGVLSAGFGGYLKKRDRNNVLDLEAHKAAAGGEPRKTGDPLT